MAGINSAGLALVLALAGAASWVGTRRATLLTASVLYTRAGDHALAGLFAVLAVLHAWIWWDSGGGGGTRRRLRRRARRWRPVRRTAPVTS